MKFAALGEALEVDPGRDRMAILSGPILVALAVHLSGRFLTYASHAPWLDVLVLGVVTTVQHVVHAGITLGGFFVPLYVQAPFVG